MNRIANPLIQMDAKINTTNGSLPITIEGGNLKAIDIDLKIPSAQIKSGLLLAALNTKETKITEHKITRDHTEIMLESFGVDIKIYKKDNKKIIKIFDKKSFFQKILMYQMTFQAVHFLLYLL